MTARPRRSHPAEEVIGRLRGTLDELIAAAEGHPLSSTQRRGLDESIRNLTGRLGVLLRDLDPVKQPEAVFDPANPALVGRFVAMGLIAQPRKSLSQVEPFYGSGVYAIYYNGDFPAYAPIRQTETPIYVGKADPAKDAARGPVEQGSTLARRLREHGRNIQRAESTLRIEDFDYRGLVVQSGWQGAAEDCLINLFKPAWNSETNICYGLGKHGDDPETRANLRSPWDTLHPGREWAHRDPEMADAKPARQIRRELREHFDRVPVFVDINQVLRSFIEQLRQIPSA